MNYCKQEHISYRDGRPFRWFTDSGCPARARKPQTVFAACCCAPFQSIEGAQSRVQNVAWAERLPVYQVLS